MNYYAAPMEGLTDRIWRQAHQRWFGAPEAPVRYYAPFLSPPENRVLIKKKMAELEPAANPGVQVIPQLLAKDGELAAWMIGELRRMGYTEVNLNFGCPSGTVTAKGKGSGMLRDPQKLDAFLDAVFSQAGGPVSVKTRLGVARAEEFGEILNVYNKYPLCELTIHPRVMKQLYRGQADREAFAAYLPACTVPVCYNGDVTTVDDLRALEAAFPGLSGIMVGRGLIADPALLRKAVGGPAASREELRGYHDELYHGYTEAFGMASCAVSRMKAHWFYLIHLFNGADALEKPLRKAREGWEYETVVNQIFACYLADIWYEFAGSREINNIMQFHNIIAAGNQCFVTALDGHHMIRQFRSAQLMQGDVQDFCFFAHLGSYQNQCSSAKFPPLAYPAHTDRRYNLFCRKHFRVYKRIYS